MKFVLSYIGFVPSAIAILASAALLSREFFPRIRARVSLRVVTVALIAFYVLYPALLTVLQWRVWSQNAFTKILLTAPLSPAVPLFGFLQPLFAHAGGYFAFYAFGRFWLHSLVVLGLAALVGLVVYLINRLRLDAIVAENRVLLVIAVLVAGWPGTVVFVPLLFGFLLAYALGCLYRGERQMRLAPALCAALGAAVLLTPLLPLQVLHI